MKSKLVRGKNYFDESLFAIAKCDYKDAQGNFRLIKGRKYEIIGIYHHGNEILDNYLINEGKVLFNSLDDKEKLKCPFELFKQEDFDLIEIKNETVDTEV